MEMRYLPKHTGVGISEPLDLNNYFNEYGAIVFGIDIGKQDNESLAKLIGTTEEEVEKLESICNTKNLLPIVPDIQVPYEGFKPNSTNYEIPEEAKTLVTIRALQGRKFETKYINQRILNYRGEINLEDTEIESGKEDLAPLQHYLLTVRVYLPGVHVKFSSSTRTTSPTVSQEFLCVSSDRLIHLRDRILCSADFQPVCGNISNDPFVTTQVTTKDINSSAAFYLGNDFYNDTRNSENVDYGEPIKKWARCNGYELGDVYKMEESTWSTVRELRLGYPYLYIHQKFCEHLIVITDVRLLHESDCMDSMKYPIVQSFASLQGKYCIGCRAKPSKYFVIGNDKVPQDVGHFCTICLVLFNYMNQIETGSFQVYRYVDRASLI